MQTDFSSYKAAFAPYDILLLPGYDNAGPEHWMTYWEHHLPTTKRVVKMIGLTQS